MEGRSFSSGTLDAYRTSMGTDDLPDYREPETDAGLLILSRNPIKLVEQVLQVFRRDAFAVIGHREPYA